MSLNATPSSERVHIGFFGRTNAGKSSVVNAVTNQALSIVSEVSGTTTDPVSKAMELLPLGPVVIIDTPGFDDETELAELRMEKARQVIAKCHIAVLVVDATIGLGNADEELIRIFTQKNINYIIAYNKCDLARADGLCVSALTGEGIEELKEAIARLSPEEKTRKIVADLISAGDIVVLVTPIDESAPKGRIILPQQQTIRDILDADAMCCVCKETELKKTLENIATPPKMVICDSQVFKEVASIVPQSIPLTSFSILMARYKGFLDMAVGGIEAMKSLSDGDTVLIAEGCTHHRQCQDIGTVKIPKGLKKYTGKTLNIKTVSGTEFYEDLSGVSLVIHCGGCMLNDKEMKNRMEKAKSQNVPVTNYGIALAEFSGILKRSLEAVYGK
ncbi:MAG: [FeFe] hydrogenase H-cluster maturation GTPase HydF [Clostridia bacterium]|nr:[FeFe] hydrogenase H-cluster maturation GTPase HydF [Clostridia bacterium]